MRNAVVIGAGRMGIRHITGLLGIDEIEKVLVIDLNQTILEVAEQSLSTVPNAEKCTYSTIDSISFDTKYEIGIVATTAGNRLAVIDLLEQLGVENALIEKPLGQSIQEVEQLIARAKKSSVTCFVNLNMRMYDYFQKLKRDFESIEQLKGFKNITMNTGSIGIGANGIHYLDLLFYLLDADNAAIVSSEIDEVKIDSPRGKDYNDFGGWAMINFFKNEELLAKAHLSLSSRSTVFGSWEFVAQHGRVYLNEVEQSRIDTLRDPKSELPIYRYFGDYQKPENVKIEPPFLGDLTKEWALALSEEKNVLPLLEDSLSVHNLLFDWLKSGNTDVESFPIT